MLLLFEKSLYTEFSMIVHILFGNMKAIADI